MAWVVVASIDLLSLDVLMSIATAGWVLMDSTKAAISTACPAATCKGELSVAAGTRQATLIMSWSFDHV